MRRFFRCLIRKNGEGKGEWRRDAAIGGAWHWQPVPGSPMSPLPERISSGSLGALLADPRGVTVWHRPLPGVPAALGSPWLVPTVAAEQVGALCTGVVCLADPAHPPLRSRGPAHLRRAGAWVTDLDTAMRTSRWLSLKWTCTKRWRGLHCLFEWLHLRFSFACAVPLSLLLSRTGSERILKVTTPHGLAHCNVGCCTLGPKEPRHSGEQAPYMWECSTRGPYVKSVDR